MGPMSKLQISPENYFTVSSMSKLQVSIADFCAVRAAEIGFALVSKTYFSQNDSDPLFGIT